MTTWIPCDGEDAGTLAITCDVTIQFVAELKTRLLECCADSARVTIDLSAAGAIDVAGLQLLCACHRYQAARGRRLRLDVGRNERFARFLVETGFARDFNCNHGGADGCLWAMPETHALC